MKKNIEHAVKVEAGRVVVINSNTQRIEYPVKTDDQGMIVCPKCGRPHLSFKNVTVIHSTIDEFQREGITEISCDVDDGSVNLTGSGRDATDDESYVLFNYNCFNNCDLSNTQLLMLEGIDRGGAVLGWSEIIITNTK